MQALAVPAWFPRDFLPCEATARTSDDAASARDTSGVAHAAAVSVD